MAGRYNEMIHIVWSFEDALGSADWGFNMVMALPCSLSRSLCRSLSSFRVLTSSPDYRCLIRGRGASSVISFFSVYTKHCAPIKQNQSAVSRFTGNFQYNSLWSINNCAPDNSCLPFSLAFPLSLFQSISTFSVSLKRPVSPSPKMYLSLLLHSVSLSLSSPLIIHSLVLYYFPLC